ncbi:BCO2 isoform 16 [Pan troglodytes]|uniref:Beta-carotene oxygenase 2 n=2 Tax=Homininae TaxID=207598 RepID=E9PPP9_HUMAN|nr:beta-carotene oxygenase 2 [Homo sapiens]PNI40675.1 BCO2 isoform 14 [Pan troglodytes]KAI2562824.1 beta-carotene oxygenase 2 [Homo sapiens]KAI4074145.1 beta-carotene oxygenase 2 [Homo sapiens]KAI4074148.1 beta-carotene oxygenase 2 [Homo sapiens]
MFFRVFLHFIRSHSATAVDFLPVMVHRLPGTIIGLMGWRCFTSSEWQRAQ